MPALMEPGVRMSRLPALHYQVVLDQSGRHRTFATCSFGGVSVGFRMLART